MGKSLTLKIGDRFINNYGNVYEVVEYHNKYNVVVNFLDYNYKKKSNSDSVKKGTVHCPFDKKYYGVGYLGLDKDGNDFIYEMIERERVLWSILLRRCYSENSLGHRPSYRGVEVCERWLCFANFLEDLPLIEGYENWLNSDQYHIDKDIKDDSTIYSLETCKFLHGSLNAKERMLRKDNPNPEKQVIGVNIENGEATLYHGMRVAQRAVGAKNHNSISRCCRGRSKYAHGHYWFYLEDFIENFPDRDYLVHSSSKEESWAKQNMINF